MGERFNQLYVVVGGGAGSLYTTAPRCPAVIVRCRLSGLTVVRLRRAAAARRLDARRPPLHTLIKDVSLTLLLERRTALQAPGGGPAMQRGGTAPRLCPDTLC